MTTTTRGSATRVPKSLRFQIFRRDNFACRYCGGVAPEAKLVVDHVTPRVLGGDNDPSNLVTACQNCNSGKAATPPDASVVADVKQSDLRWSEAMTEAAQRETVTKVAHKMMVSVIGSRWEDYNLDGQPIPRGAGWARSICTIFDAGLRYEAMAEAVEIAMLNPRITAENKWRYFCGICWRKIENLQQVAAGIMAESSE